MQGKGLKKLARLLRKTPLHPQWLVYRKEQWGYQHAGTHARGKVLDIGRSDQSVQPYLSARCEYVGLDYYNTAVHWYQTRPSVYATATALPFSDQSFDTVLFIDVAEHLVEPQFCMTEICRVLRPGGRLIFQVPCIYPIHDAPLDFLRWTEFGAREMIRKSGLIIEEEQALSSSAETAGMIVNIAAGRTLLDWLDRRHPAMLIGWLIPLFVLGVNLISWLLARILPVDRIMPRGYRYVLRRA
jgi:SAM-dependent methyltransferase